MFSGSAAPSGPSVARVPVEVDGLSVSVLVGTPVEPAAALPPVLAVHGFASSAHFTWERTGHLRELLRAGRSVIAPDLPGHGSSSRPHEPAAYALERLCRVVTGVAAQLAPDAGALDLVGYSLGARISATLLTAEPERWRRAVLGGYDGRVLFDGVDVAALEAVMAGAVAPEAAAVPAATRRIAQLVGAVPGNDPAALAALVAGLGRVGPGPDLPPLPVLVVAGSADPLADRAAALVERSLLAELLVVPGRDHVSTVPSAVYRRGLVAFLAQPSRGTSSESPGTSS